jgi:hypothetical protein
MMKFSVDYTDLQNKLSQKKAFRLLDVKDKLKKVAFDVVRFTDSDKIDDLWQIHRDGDDEYIIAMYDDDQTEKKAVASSNPWSAIPDTLGNNINIFYNKNPIKRIKIASLGIPSEDAWLVSHSIMDKLANDKLFFNSFIKELTKEEKTSLNEINPSLLAGK